MASRTGSRLASAFLVYLLGVVILVTLVPFDFSTHTPHHLLWTGSGADALANVAMYFPLGFLVRLTHDSDRDRRALRPLLWGLGLSALIESAQLFLPSRFSSPLDVATNGLGAWLGALAHDFLIRRIRLTPALVGALALELPLMGLIYLLLPLLWLSGLAASGEPARLGLSLLLGLAGAVVLGAIHRHRLGPAGAVGAVRFALLAVAWYLVGAIPGLAEHPLIVAVTALLVGSATWLLGGARTRNAQQADRRFESETLLRMAPVLAFYLLCLTGWPPWSPLTAWHGVSGLHGLWGSTDTILILRTLEHLAGFTVLGYALAESRGRRERSFRQSMAGLAGWAMVASAVLELVAARHSAAGCSLLRGGIAVAAAVYGGGIYHLQRSHIRWLLGSPSESAREGTAQPIGATALRPRQSEQTEAPAWAGQTG
jgi:VanZ family protein